MLQRFAIGLVTAGLFAGAGVSAHQAKPAAPAAKPAPAPAKSGGAAKPGAGTGPVLVVETAKGNFEITTYTEDAPKSLAHVMELVNQKTFYQGQRILWAQANAVGFGDPNSKNMTKKDLWGTGGSGNAVGVAETSKRKFDKGLVVLYYQKGYPPKTADSQIMILKQANNSPEVEGKYAVLGKVTSGMDVVDKLEMTDVIRKFYVKEAAPGK
jgi:cyclophilin family peptidyl-prolyl cis-trans isomerase